MKPQLYEHLQVAWKNVHGKEARLLLLDYQKARTRAGFTRAAAVANQQEPRRGALIWTGCGKELALSPCLRRPGFHFEVNATCPSIILFSELCCWFSSVTLVKAYDASVLWREQLAWGKAYKLTGSKLKKLSRMDCHISHFKLLYTIFSIFFIWPLVFSNSIEQCILEKHIT